MPQYPVTGYALQVSTAPPQPSGVAPAPFTTRILIQFQPGGQFQPLPVHSTEEFMAMVALIQTPGRLMYDSQLATLEKIQP